MTGFFQFSSVQLLSHVWLFAALWTTACQASLSITNSQGLLKLIFIELWCHPTILSSVIPFSSCLQSFPASGFFQMSQFFASGGQNIGISASASVLPVNIQDLFPLGLIGLISLLFKGLSRVFSNTTVQKHQFFGVQLSLSSNSHIHNVFKVYPCCRLYEYFMTLYEWIISPCMDISYFVYMFVPDGHLICVYIFTILNNANMNINMWIFVWTYIFVSLGHIPRSRITDSMFKPVNNLQNVFQSGFTVLLSHTLTRVLIFPHAC